MSIIEGLLALAEAHPAPASSQGSGVQAVLDALSEFDACIRYLNTRRSAGAVINLASEADVQDALYLIVRPWITDLVGESPTAKAGNRYSIRDFVSAQHRFVLEAKYVRDKEHAKNISKELHDDIEMYRLHQHCDHLIFFIYDPNSLIPDQRALRATIEVDRVYDGRRLSCYLLVRP